MGENDPDAEVSGQYVVPFIQAAGEVSPVFERKVNERFKQEVGEVNPEGWYRAGDIWQVYETILDDVGPKTMEQGGEKTAETLPFDENTGVDEAINILRAESVSDDTYRKTDADRPAGQYTHDISEGGGHLGLTEGYPFPVPFAKGLYQGIIKQCVPGASPEFTETDPRPDERFAWTVEW